MSTRSSDESRAGALKSSSAEDYRRRTKELAALYATAGDLSSMRDMDRVLAAIVRRGRELLGTDMAYLMLIDHQRADTFMRVSVGTQTPDFMSIRLKYGEGIGGLAAKSAAPQWTRELNDDPRFAASIGPIVEGEGISAILAVPLIIADEVIGVLFASDRRPRDFRHEEVALLASLADHAAIALENARLFEERESSLHQLREANQRIEHYNERLVRAADMHEQLTRLVATGAAVSEVAAVVSQFLGGRIVVLDDRGVPLTHVPQGFDVSRLPLEDGATLPLEGAAVSATEFARVAAIRTNTSELGFLVHVGRDLEPTDLVALERAAMVTALLLLDVRAHDEALSRVMNELFSALLDSAADDDEEVRSRAAAAGLRLGAGPFVVMCAIEAAQRRRHSSLGAPLATLSHQHGGLAGTIGGRSIAIMHSTDAKSVARQSAERLTHLLGDPVTVGSCGPFPTLRAAAANAFQAVNCAKVLVTLGRAGDAATPEELGLYTLLFSDVARQQIETFVSQTVGMIASPGRSRNGDLLRTVEAYFEHGGQTGQIAQALFIHVNTLYQRLERLDALLGSSWRRGDQALQVHLAVKLRHFLTTTAP